MQKITKIFPYTFSKALCQSFHTDIATILEESGIAQELDVKEIVTEYKQLADELQGLVSLSRQLESTPAIHEAMEVISKRMRYMYRMFNTFALNDTSVSQEEYKKLKNEIIEVFPLTILHLGWAERLGKLEILVAHLQSDWVPLLEKMQLKETYLEIAKQVEALKQSILSRSEEKSDIEPAHPRRVMNELYETYSLLCLYIEAWSNTKSQEPVLKERQQKATNALKQINEMIGSVKQSRAVARSNRRRSKK